MSLSWIVIGLISLLIGGLVFSLVFLIYLTRWTYKQRSQLDKAVHDIGFSPEKDFQSQQEDTGVSGWIWLLVSYSRQLMPSEWFGKLVDLISSPERNRKLSYKLSQAGWKFYFNVREFTGAQLIASMLLTALAAFYLLALNFEFFYYLGLPLVTYASFRLMEARITSRIESRQTQIKIELPGAVDILKVSVDAGLTLNRAIALYVERFPGAVAQELTQVQNEIAIGRPRSEALRDMARRTGMPEVELLISSIVQAERFGVPVAQVLHSQSVDLKLKRSQHFREQAQKAPVKMVVPIALLIMPALLCVLLGPLAIQMMSGGLF